MEVVKQRLAAIRNEENELRDKSSDLDSQIKSVRIDNDKIQIELQGLISTEKLINMKIDTTNERLNKVLLALSNKREVADSSERELESLTAATENLSCKEEDLEAQLAEVREKSRKIQVEYDEALIHLQHMEEAKRKKLSQAEAAEKQVEALERQHSTLMKAWGQAETTDLHGDIIDDLECELKKMQTRLEKVTDAYETSEREASRLDRLINGVKQDLVKQQAENDTLRKELDGIFHELEGI